MQPRHISMAILVAAVWGLNFIAVKWAVQDFPPLLANSLRFAGVFLVFLPFLKKVPGRMPQLLSMAFLMGVVHFGVMFLAISISDGVGAVAIAAQLTVPFSTILAIIFLKESVGWKRVTGVAISFGGVLVIGWSGTSKPSDYCYASFFQWINRPFAYVRGVAFCCSSG